MKFSLKNIALGLLVIAASVGGSLLIARVVVSQKNAPLQPCLQPFDTAKQTYVRLSHVEDKDADYYLYSVGAMAHPGYWEPLIVVQSGVCRVLNSKREESDHPLSEFVTPAVAQKLAMGSMQRKIQAAGGKAEFEAGLAKEVKGAKKPLLMPTEYYRALQGLGVKIPANIKPFDGVPNADQVEEERG